MRQLKGFYDVIVIKVFIVTPLVVYVASKSERGQRTGRYATQFNEALTQVLDPFLIPRVAGTPGNLRVQQHIKSTLGKLGWNIEEDGFTEKTVIGERAFNNVIATQNPGACKRLVLACHFDSMLSSNFNFVGLTDSAVPCFMLLHLAQSLDKLLSQKKGEKTLQLIFFDGEEAFRSWSTQDSLYGSRHLAQKWANAPKSNPSCQGQHRINQIELFVLLDLIGAKKPRFHSYFRNTNAHFSKLRALEQRLSRGKQLKGGSVSYFSRWSKYSARVEDDHIPFLRKNVPILHLIPSPFPAVWHQPSDNKSALDLDSVWNLSLILKAFVRDYLSL